MTVPYNFAPHGWAFCDGQQLAITQNTALYSLLGTTYGGDGRTTFALPDLRGRVPMHAGQGPGTRSHRLGEKAGTESVTLSRQQMPTHSHQINVTEARLEAYEGSRGETANAQSPGGNILGNTADQSYYDGKAPNTSLESDALGVNAEADQAGESQAHTNMQPYTVLHFIIALQGIYPSRS